MKNLFNFTPIIKHVGIKNNDGDPLYVKELSAAEAWALEQESDKGKHPTPVLSAIASICDADGNRLFAFEVKGDGFDYRDADAVSIGNWPGSVLLAVVKAVNSVTIDRLAAEVAEKND